MADLTAKATWSSDTRALQRDISRTERRMDQFGKKMSTTFERAGKSIDRASTAILSGSRGLIGGAAIGMAAKRVIEFDGKLARMAIAADLSKKEMVALKKELYEFSKITKQPPDDLLEGLNAFVKRTGDFEYAIGTLKDMGIVASATGSSMADIGATAANLQSKMGIAKEEILAVFDVLAAQGKVGAFEISDMASNFEKLLSAATRFNIKGMEGMRTYGAFIQMAKRGTGTPEEATTAVERTIDDILSKHKEIRRLTGFSIIDAEASKKAGRTVMKDFDLVLKEIISRTNGDVLKLKQIFNEVSIRAVTPLAESYLVHGGWSEFDKFARTGGDGAAIMKDFAFWADTAAAKFGEFNTELKKFTDNLEGPINLLTKLLDLLNAHPNITQGALTTLLTVGLGAGAYKIGKGGYSFGKKAVSLGRDVYKKIMARRMLSRPPAVSLDRPLSGGGEIFWDTAGWDNPKVSSSGQKAANKGLRALLARAPKGFLSWKNLLKAGRLVGRYSPHVTAGMVGWEVGGAAGQWIDDQTGNHLGAFGEWIYDITHKPPEVQNHNHITLNLGSDGRVTTSVDNMKDSVEVKTNRGSLLR